MSVHSATNRSGTGNTVIVPIALKGQEPQVEVLREGEVVKSIRVTCTCGASVDIACDYTDAK